MCSLCQRAAQLHFPQLNAICFSRTCSIWFSNELILTAPFCFIKIRLYSHGPKVSFLPFGARTGNALEKMGRNIPSVQIALWKRASRAAICVRRSPDGVLPSYFVYNLYCIRVPGRTEMDRRRRKRELARKCP